LSATSFADTEDSRKKSILEDVELCENATPSSDAPRLFLTTILLNINIDLALAEPVAHDLIHLNQCRPTADTGIPGGNIIEITAAGNRWIGKLPTPNHRFMLTVAAKFSYV
jgi:hypothetical protein